VTLTMTPTVTVGQPVFLTATVTPHDATGTVLFAVSPQTLTPCSVQVINGEAHCSMTPLLPGLFASPLLLSGRILLSEL